MKATALGDLRVVHSLPGRTRLKFSELKTYPHRHANLGQRLMAIDGIHQVDTNPTTGSVVLYHDQTAVYSIEFLSKVASAFGLATIEPAKFAEWLALLEDEGESAPFDLVRDVKQVGTTIGDLLGGRLDGKTLLPSLLILLGMRSLLISEMLVAPKWYEYFWFAFGVYFTLNKPDAPGNAAT